LNEKKEFQIDMDETVSVFEGNKKMRAPPLGPRQVKNEESSDIVGGQRRRMNPPINRKQNNSEKFE
jgi:hypothetical protein